MQFSQKTEAEAKKARDEVEIATKSFLDYKVSDELEQKYKTCVEKITNEWEFDVFSTEMDEKSERYIRQFCNTAYREVELYEGRPERKKANLKKQYEQITE